jgi:hypothetical protein
MVVVLIGNGLDVEEKDIAKFRRHG